MTAQFQESTRFLDLLRHGETTGGVCFRGERDDALTALGWVQMARATADAPAWTGIISSPARRCAEFARQIATQHELPLRIDAAFREWHFGAWEGLTAAQIPAAHLAQFWNDPAAFTPPDAEPFTVFRARVALAWRELLATSASTSHQLLITHGGVIRVLIAEVLHLPSTALALLEVPPANLTRLRLSEPPGQPSVLFHRSA